MNDRLRPDLAERLDDLRRKGALIIGPGPTAWGPPTAAAGGPHAGFSVQLGVGSRFVQGSGTSPDMAVQDALRKLGEVQADRPVHL